MEDAHIQLITGGSAADERGCVRFVNDFHFTGVKRFYQVENVPGQPIRGFHGHMNEAKYVYVPAGKALVCAVRLTDPKNPDKTTPVEKYILGAEQPGVLYIPPGYANGFKVLVPGTQVQFFSTSTVDESKADDYRFPFDYWGSKVWDVENR